VEGDPESAKIRRTGYDLLAPMLLLSSPRRLSGLTVARLSEDIFAQRTPTSTIFSSVPVSRDAKALVPYLSDLGITDLYARPYR
jgi:hypothetical protein